MKQTEKSALAQQRIIEAAMREISAKGYNGMSLNMLCETYNISKGLIYHHFQDKDTLYLACVKKCFEKLILYVNEIAEALSGTIDEQLSKYFNARLQFFVREPLCMGMFADVMFRPPVTLATQIEEIRKPFDDLNLSIIRNLLSNKPLRSDLSLETTAKDFRVFMDVFNAQFGLMLHNENGIEQATVEHEQTAKRQISILLHGMMNEGG